MRTAVAGSSGFIIRDTQENIHVFPVSGCHGRVSGKFSIKSAYNFAKKVFLTGNICYDERQGMKKNRYNELLFLKFNIDL